MSKYHTVYHYSVVVDADCCLYQGIVHTMHGTEEAAKKIARHNAAKTHNVRPRDVAVITCTLLGKDKVLLTK